MARRVKRKQNVIQNSNKQEENKQKENFSITIYKELDKNITNLKKMLGEPIDLVVRPFTVRGTEHKCAIAYIDGLVNDDLIHSHIMKNVQLETERKQLPDEKVKLFEVINNEIISASTEKGYTLDDLSNALLNGDTIFYLDGIDKVLLIDTRGWESRAIEEPDSETVIRGPREGFVENIQTNLVLLRRHIRDPNLRLKKHYIGRRSKKTIAVTYVDGIINPDIVKEVDRRLRAIDMDDAPGVGYIEQWIEDSFLSPFPQLINTERPDKVSAALLQGKLAIFLDGTPLVLVLPATFGNALQSPEDYYERWTIGTLIRGLRYLAAFISVFLPALYVALVSYHPGMIPQKLAFSIAATREGVPFPPFIEALLMTITMELLREAGARLPTTIGQTIGIVGGLVIGEAAVQAGIVSPIMVIVVALNAIASFAIPSYSVAISFRILLFGFLIASAVFGLFGIILAYIMINIHLVNLKSIGVPYSTPFAPTFLRDWNDLIFRSPIPLISRRPKYLQAEDEKSGNTGGKNL
ncbi:spore germination protein [Virgibacillus alimentarius]|uniref:spore germination protein n=1 Tax=Virgibacillus alimentarius TaxID=698769 RepID=UPI00049364CC|nr:spore germination protein [Virgibacillus alimentarius]